MQKLFLRSQNLIACFSHTAFFFFFQQNSLFQYQFCRILPVTMVILHPTTTSLLKRSQLQRLVLFFVFFNYNSACFTAGDIFLFMGFILRGPERLHPHGCEGEPGIRCISPSPLNGMLQQLNECTNKVLDSSYLRGTGWSRQHLLQWTRILMKSKMCIIFFLNGEHVL